MYRGSSFLLNFDYRIHIRTVEIIFEFKDLCIEGNLFDNLSHQNHLFNDEGVYSKLVKYYSDVKKHIERNTVKNIMPSDTLITKILLGVYGCIPAYDR